VLVVAFVAYALTLALSRPPTGSLVVPSPSATLHDGSPAPEHFSLPRLGGGRLSLAVALDGRPGVINFFASWCTLCREELSDFASTARHYGEAVAFVGVDTDDPGGLPALHSLVAETQVGYPVLIDTSVAVVAHAYGISGLPVTIILDASGKVRAEFLGRVKASTLNAVVSPLVGSSTA